MKRKYVRVESFLGRNEKRCTKCLEIKKLEDFSYKTSKRIARRESCKECDKKLKQTAEYKHRQKIRTLERRKDPLFQSRSIEMCRNYGKTTRGRANRLFLAARHRAKINDLEFSITQDFIEGILNKGVCQRTGLVFSFESPKKGRFNPLSPSVDKKDCYSGYTKENIQIVCNAYNLAKHQMSDEEFIEFCKTVVEKNT